MLPGFDAITDDGGFAQRLRGFKPVQALDQYEARAILAHQDRRLLANSEHAVCDRTDALQVERFAPRGRHVDIGDREGLAFQHVEEGDLAAIESVAPIALPLDANHTHFCAYIEDTGAGAQSRTTLSQTVCR